MRYETTQNYHVDLFSKYHTKDQILHVSTDYGDKLAQQKLIDLRSFAANGSDKIGNYCLVIDGKSVNDLPYFKIETHTLDAESEDNNCILRNEYKRHLRLIKTINRVSPEKNVVSPTFDEFLAKNNQIDVAILTKRIQQQNTLCTLFNPAYFSDRFGIIAINIFETFDFENLRVNLKVVLDTEETLTARELSDLSDDIDGQMSDGWGESYEIAKVDEFHDVSGWMFATEPVKALIPSRHTLYYPVNRKGV